MAIIDKQKLKEIREELGALQTKSLYAITTDDNDMHGEKDIYNQIGNIIENIEEIEK